MTPREGELRKKLDSARRARADQEKQRDQATSEAIRRLAETGMAEWDSEIAKLTKQFTFEQLGHQGPDGEPPEPDGGR